MSITIKDPNSSVPRFLYLASTDQAFYEAFVEHATKVLVSRSVDIKHVRVSFDDAAGGAGDPGDGLTYGPIIPGGGGTGGGGG